MATGRGVDWLMDAALEALPVGVVVVDAAGSLSFANGRARELLALHAGDRVPGYLRTVVDSLGGPAGVVDTVDIPGADGTTVVARIRAAAIHGATVCTIDDLTERSRRDRADREFITNAAHQLRTPITAIATAIEVLQGGAKETPEARDRFLGHIERQTDRLVRLVRAMLALSRAERGDVGPSLGLVPLRPMLEGLVEELSALRGTAVELDCPSIASVVADEALLSEALSNLIGNALDHAGTGTVRVAVSEHDEASAVTIEVVDTGAGIASDELERVFERFHRGTEEGGGAGLGLPIAKAAVEAQGGTLELESSPGRGTTARVRIPRR